MKFQAPEFWTKTEGRDAAPGLRALLTPAAWLYGYMTQRRIDTTTPYDAGIPVICVGNATAGGTGKTPVVAEILSMIRAQKIRAESLSRGYGGTERGPMKVNADHTAKEVGDEPLLLANRSPAWVAVSRVDGARAMAASGTQVIVMDDGHQNPSLEKALSILVVDGETGFGNGRVIPAGPLREPVARAMERTDVVIVMKPNREYKIAQSLKDQFGYLPVIEAYLTPTAPLPNGPLFAFAGIGRPNKFFDALRAAGAELVEGMRFADHYAYSAADIKHLQDMAREYKAQLVTTEKDFVRLPSALRQYVAVWPVRCVFQDELTLERLLSPIIDTVKKAR